MKRLKFFLFIPVCLVALGLINIAFIYLLDWTIDRTNQWYKQWHISYFILWIPFFWGTIWGIFKLSALGTAALLIPFSPDKKFSLYSLATISLISCAALIGHYWARDVDYTWKVILMSMIISVFIIDFSASIVMVFSKSESYKLGD